MNVYVEVPFDGDTEGLEIKNTIFFESFTEQKNLTTVKIGEKKSDHLFKSGDEFKSIKMMEMKK